MVRNFKKITSRGEIPPDVMLRAVRRVKIDHVSIRKVATEFQINYRTLSRYVKKIEDADINANVDVPSIPVGYIKNQVFSAEAENKLVSYALQASKLHLGLSPKELRQLAYEVGEANKLKMPQNWINNKMAGADWLNSFIKKHPTLSIRKAEATTLGSSYNGYIIGQSDNRCNDSTESPVKRKLEEECECKEEKRIVKKNRQRKNDEPRKYHKVKKEAQRQESDNEEETL